MIGLEKKSVNHWFYCTLFCGGITVNHIWNKWDYLKYGLERASPPLKPKESSFPLIDAFSLWSNWDRNLADVKIHCMWPASWNDPTWISLLVRYSFSSSNELNPGKLENWREREGGGSGVVVREAYHRLSLKGQSFKRCRNFPVPEGHINHTLCWGNKDSLDEGLSIFCGPAVLILLECWLKTFAVSTV